MIMNCVYLHSKCVSCLRKPREVVIKCYMVINRHQNIICDCVSGERKSREVVIKCYMVIIRHQNIICDCVSG